MILFTAEILCNAIMAKTWEFSSFFTRAAKFHRHLLLVPSSTWNDNSQTNLRSDHLHLSARLTQLTDFVQTVNTTWFVQSMAYTIILLNEYFQCMRKKSFIQANACIFINLTLSLDSGDNSKKKSSISEEVKELKGISLNSLYVSHFIAIIWLLLRIFKNICHLTNEFMNCHSIFDLLNIVRFHHLEYVLSVQNSFCVSVIGYTQLKHL